MSRKQIKLDIKDLKIGMYVSQLDRPWIETPFVIQGLLIKGSRDITALARHCAFVYVDIEKSSPQVIKKHFVLEARSKVSTILQKPDRNQAPKGPAGNKKSFKRICYKNNQSIDKEIPEATIAFQDLTVAMQKVFKDLRNNRDINLIETQTAAKEMVASVIRNPDAFVWLARVKEKDTYSYEHSIRAAILAAVFGRHLGLPPITMQNLCMGVLLSEVGMAKIDTEILQKKGKLTPEEYSQVQKHVEYGAEILSHTPGISEQVIQVVWNHHERHNGSGYPRQLRGQQIHPLGKIAGIVDCYDAMTSPRNHARLVSTSEAMSNLYKMRNREFQSELVEQFIQAIGLYPTGTLVQLSTDEVGVIIAQNPERRLQPKVMVVLDENKIPVVPAKIVDLKRYENDGHKVSVSMDLKAGAFDIYPQNLMVVGE